MPRQEQHNCSNCGRQATDVVTNERTGGAVCSLCSDIILFQSVADNRYYPRSERVMGSTGWMTQEQKDDEHNYVECNCCGERGHREDMGTYTDTYGDIEYICEDCEPDETFYCENHGVRYHNDVGYWTVQTRHGEQYWCQDAVDEDAATCPTCQEIYVRDDMEWHEETEEHYCDECGVPEPDYEVEVHNYYYNPSTVFNQVTNEIRKGKYMKRDMAYFGVELEVDTEDYFRDVANRCPSLADEDYIYCKEDSSTDGFEIITQPMTFEYHKQFGWRDILKEVHDAGGRGYDSGNCGIHVHITKSSYSPIVWWKVIEFIYKCKSYVQRFSQRNGNYTYCQYLPASSYEGYRNKKEQYPTNSQRYVALNFPDRHPTAEFRLFRSTTKHERFWASLEFTHALMLFCSNHGYACIKRYDAEKVWNMFIKYVAENTPHQSLLKHLKRRQLTNNALCA